MDNEIPFSIRNDQRKLAEWKLVQNMDDEPTCWTILRDGFNMGIFTEDEVNFIAEEIRKINAPKHPERKAENPEHTRITRAMFMELGPSVSMVLAKLIRQLPYRQSEPGWLIPDIEDIKKSVKIEEASVYNIFNRLVDKGIIEKRINRKIKKIEIRIDFYALDRIYNKPEEKKAPETTEEA